MGKTLKKEKEYPTPKKTMTKFQTNNHQMSPHDRKQAQHSNNPINKLKNKTVPRQGLSSILRILPQITISTIKLQEFNCFIMILPSHQKQNHFQSLEGNWTSIDSATKTNHEHTNLPPSINTTCNSPTKRENTTRKHKMPQSS